MKESAEHLEADLRGWLPMVGLPQSEETIDRLSAKKSAPATARSSS